MMDSLDERKWRDLNAKLDAAQLEISRLRSAATSFANIKADDNDDFSDTHPEVVLRVEITAGELHKLRAALKGESI